MPCEGALVRDPVASGADEAQDEARHLADVTKQALARAEDGLRRDPEHAGSVAAVGAALGAFQRSVTELFAAHPGPTARDAAADVLAHELRPYLLRSTLANRTIHRGSARIGGPAVLAHVLRGAATGDGALGTTIDAWLLGSASLRALRALPSSIVRLAAADLPTTPRRVLLLHAGTGSLVAALADALRDAPTEITVVDGSREALALCDPTPEGGGPVRIERVQESVSAVAFGRHRHDLGRQDRVILHNTVEYLPGVVLFALLGAATQLLAPGGRVVLGTLGPAVDAVLLDRVLAWPSLRRTRDNLAHALGEAGLQIVTDAGAAPPAIALSAAPTPSPEDGTS